MPLYTERGYRRSISLLSRCCSASSFICKKVSPCDLTLDLLALQYCNDVLQGPPARLSCGDSGHKYCRGREDAVSQALSQLGGMSNKAEEPVSRTNRLIPVRQNAVQIKLWKVMKHGAIPQVPILLHALEGTCPNIDVRTFCLLIAMPHESLAGWYAFEVSIYLLVRTA